MCGKISEIKLSGSAVAVICEEDLGESTKVDMAGGALLITIRAGQNMKDVLPILEEHNRAQAERYRRHA